MGRERGEGWKRSVAGSAKPVTLRRVVDRCSASCAACSPGAFSSFARTLLADGNAPSRCRRADETRWPSCVVVVAEEEEEE